MTTTKWTSAKRPDAFTLTRIASAFDPALLTWICEASAPQIAESYGPMTEHKVSQPAPHDRYWYADNGADILFVAHLDTVMGGVDAEGCPTSVIDTEDGPFVASGALDDRLGAYVGLELLPALGCEFDYLFTVGEEMGMSTAASFTPPEGKEYRWIIEFDRGGTDVVLYQYEDDDLVGRVEATGARVEPGIFSDISYLEHLGLKAMNWGVGYRDYHGPRSHAWLADTFRMVAYFLDFYETHREVTLPHTPSPHTGAGGYGSAWLGGGYWWDDIDFDADGDGKPVSDHSDTEVADCLEFVDDEINCAGPVREYTFGLLCDGHHTLYFE